MSPHLSLSPSPLATSAPLTLVQFSHSTYVQHTTELTYLFVMLISYCLSSALECKCYDSRDFFPHLHLFMYPHYMAHSR